jgi:hypothetical protein
VPRMGCLPGKFRLRSPDCWSCPRLAQGTTSGRNRPKRRKTSHPRFGPCQGEGREFESRFERGHRPSPCLTGQASLAGQICRPGNRIGICLPGTCRGASLLPQPWRPQAPLRGGGWSSWSLSLGKALATHDIQRDALWLAGHKCGHRRRPPLLHRWAAARSFPCGFTRPDFRNVDDIRGVLRCAHEQQAAIGVIALNLGGLEKLRHKLVALAGKQRLIACVLNVLAHFASPVRRSNRLGVVKERVTR